MQIPKTTLPFLLLIEACLTLEILNIETKQEKPAECNEEQWDAIVQILNKIVCKHASYYFLIAINSNNSKVII